MNGVRPTSCAAPQYSAGISRVPSMRVAIVGRGRGGDVLGDGVGLLGN